MGNCLKSTKVMEQDEPSREIKANEPAGQAPARSKSEGARRVARGKKVVRFKLQEEDTSSEGLLSTSTGDGSGGGALRIRVVVSQKELKQILNDKDKNICTLEQMIAELRTKGRTISDARTSEDGDKNGSWRPALESIPEEFH